MISDRVHNLMTYVVFGLLGWSISEAIAIGNTPLIIVLITATVLVVVTYFIDDWNDTYEA